MKKLLIISFGLLNVVSSFSMNELVKAGKVDEAGAIVVNEILSFSRSCPLKIANDNIISHFSSEWDLKYKLGSYAFACWISGFKANSANLLFNHTIIPDCPNRLPIELLTGKKIRESIEILMKDKKYRLVLEIDHIS